MKEIKIKLGLQSKPASRTSLKNQNKLAMVQLLSYGACSGREEGLLGHISMPIAGAA